MGKGTFNMQTISTKTAGRSTLSMDEQEKADLAQRYEDVRQGMKKAFARIPGGDTFPELIAVSKTFPAQRVSLLLDLGHRVFGENRVQEALGKWPALKERYEGVQLHLIGPLQTNKVSDALEVFDVIQSVDREKLARILAREMKKTGKDLPCFVQVNIGREPQKSGIDPDEAVGFVRRCRQEHGLDVRGLMCIPPAGEAPGPYFARLNMLAGEAGLGLLSMGMSSDYAVAIEMGATHIRVGSALFGER